MIADLVAFDPDEVVETGTYQDPVRYPRGIFAVIVAGAVAMKQGRLTGERSGRALRKTAGGR